jgi:hypothetical protein
MFVPRLFPCAGNLAMSFPFWWSKNRQFLHKTHRPQGLQSRAVGRLERLEDRTLLAGHTQATATLLNLASDHITQVSGTLTPGVGDWYQFTATDSGRLTASVDGGAAGSFQPRLSLYASGGQLLISSDGAAAHPSAQVDQHLRAGSYFLLVGAAAGDGPYQLSGEYQLSSEPFHQLVAGIPVQSVLAQDVN